MPGYEQCPMALATSRSKTRNKQQGIYLKPRPIKFELTRRLIIVPISAQRASEARPARAMCTGGGPAFPRFGVRPGPRLIRSACEGPDVAHARTRWPLRIDYILLEGGGIGVENPPCDLYYRQEAFLKEQWASDRRARQRMGGCCSSPDRADESHKHKTRHAARPNRKKIWEQSGVITLRGQGLKVREYGMLLLAIGRKHDASYSALTPSLNISARLPTPSLRTLCYRRFQMM